MLWTIEDMNPTMSKIVSWDLCRELLAGLEFLCLLESFLPIWGLIMSLKRAKTADTTTKDIVFGFIRNHEKSESVSAPEMIKYLILNYYLLRDAFDTKDKGSVIELSDNSRLATFTGAQMADSSINRLVFGEIPILDEFEGLVKYRWTLKIEKKRIHSNLVLGLGPRRDCSAHSRNSNWSSECPGFFGILFSRRGAFEITNGEKYTPVDRLDRQPANVLKKDDIIDMILDTDRDLLHFLINGRHLTSLKRSIYLNEKRHKHYLTLYRVMGKGGTLAYRLVDFSVQHCSTKSNGQSNE